MREKKNIYFRLALTGIAKNYRMYVPYLLACTGMVMMSYILYFLIASPQVANMRGGGTLQEMLRFGEQVFAVFCVIFLYYTNSFLLRGRKREFGLYNILGMGKRNLARIMLWENAVVAGVSIAAGSACGILFSKLAELCIAYVLKTEVSMRFTVETGALAQTVRLFLLIFLLLLLNALFQVGKTKPIDLLNSEAVGERPPKGNWFLALAGFAMLAAAYVIAVRIEDPMAAFMTFFFAVGMVIVATYLVFIAGSVLICRLLKKNKKYYYKANHFVSVSSMAYRMKRNGAGLASICILSTIVLVMLSAASCLYFGNSARLTWRYPRQIEVYAYAADEAQHETIAAALSGAAQENGLAQENALFYRYLDLAGYLNEDMICFDETKMDLSDFANIWAVYVLPLSDYNRVTGNSETLADGEALACTYKKNYDSDAVTLENCGTWKLRRGAEDFPRQGEETATVFGAMYLVVPEEDFAAIEAGVKPFYDESRGSAFVRYYGFDVAADEQGQSRTASTMRAKLAALAAADADFPNYACTCRAEAMEDFYALYGGLFVLGILLGLVFLAATVLIMYYKQITEGFEDRARFGIMQKVGMTDREIRSSIHSQMFTVFLLPLLLAVVHTCFAFPMVQKLLLLFGIVKSHVLLRTNLICFFVFGLFYAVVYLITSRGYYKIVRGAAEAGEGTASRHVRRQ